MADSAPAFVDIDNDGDLDFFTGTTFGTVALHKNTGTSTNPIFEKQADIDNPLSFVDNTGISRPAFVDIDNDGDMDLFVGETFGDVQFFENTGSASSASFVERIGAANPLDGAVIGGIVSDDTAPALVDIDNDGDFDAFIGDLYGTMHFFRNTGSAAAPVFTSPPANQNPLDGESVLFSSAPTFGDFDDDGDFDCMVGSLYGAISYYENTGNVSNATFTNRTGLLNPLDGVVAGALSAPAMVDIDNDGDIDIFIGEYLGSIVFVPTSTTVLMGVYADFDAAPNGNGTATDPVNTVADSLAAGEAGCTVIMEPGNSSELFSGSNAINQAVTLTNGNSAGGVVRIGGPGARSTSTGGFISRSAK